MNRKVLYRLLDKLSTGRIAFANKGDHPVTTPQQILKELSDSSFTPVAIIIPETASLQDLIKARDVIDNEIARWH